MSTLVTLLVSLVGLGGGQPAQPATRVMEGRVTDAQGRPVREGKIMFAPQNPPLAFHESWTAAIDPQGHFRIELSTLSIPRLSDNPGHRPGWESRRLGGRPGRWSNHGDD